MNENQEPLHAPEPNSNQDRAPLSEDREKHLFLKKPSTRARSMVYGISALALVAGGIQLYRNESAFESALSFNVQSSSEEPGENTHRMEIKPGTSEYRFITEHCGLDVDSLQEKFYIDAEVPNRNGPCIVHIGQRHAENANIVGSQDTEERRKQAIDSQKTNYDALVEMHAKGANTMFPEGIDSVDENSFTEFLKNDVKKIRLAPITNDGLNGFITDYNNFIELAHNADHQEAEGYVKYSFQQRAPAFEEAIKNGTIDSTGKAYEYFQEIKAGMEKRGIVSEDDLLYWGAKYKLVYDGVFENIVPIENSEIHAKQEEGYNRYKIAHDLFYTAVPKDTEQISSDPQFMGLYTEYKKAKENFKQTTEARESFVIHSIATSWNQDMGNTLPLILGEDHKLKDNVEEHNIQANAAKTPELALIKLTQKDD